MGDGHGVERAVGGDFAGDRLGYEVLEVVEVSGSIQEKRYERTL